LKENFGLGLKDSIVRTQFEDQIGEDEVPETLRQAPTDKNDLIFLIHFQSLEADDGIGEEMKSPYLMYFF
jgi:hypothetical protein